MIKEAPSVCPKCKAEFLLSENSAYQVKRKVAPFWFFDALKQFENYNVAVCPNCKHRYKDETQRLLFVFKSPYVMLFTVCFMFFLIVISLTIIKYYFLN